MVSPFLRCKEHRNLDENYSSLIKGQLLLLLPLPLPLPLVLL
jgi:hypothetical protein